MKVTSTKFLKVKKNNPLMSEKSTLDITPSRRGYTRMLLTIIESTTVEEDRQWAKAEIFRLVGNKPWE